MNKIVTNYLKAHRNPGWVELFFDLAFVVLLGRMAHILFHTHHGELGPTAVVSFAWIFWVQWLVWMIYTVYMNIYGNDSLHQNGLTFILMVCVIVTAILMNDLVSNVKYIALSLGVMSMVISILYMISKDAVPDHCKYARYKSVALIVLSVLTIAVFLMDSRYVMLYVAAIYGVEHLLADIVTFKVGCAKPDGEHFIERIGIFMILLLGESLLTVVNNVPHDISFNTLSPVFIILIILFGLWINYYTFIENLVKIQYVRYSEILSWNLLVIIGLTLFPAIVYHGIHQELNLGSFKFFIIVFSMLFYGGIGMSHARVHIESRGSSIAYGIVPTIMTIGLMAQFTSYLLVLMSFLLVTILTQAITIFIYFKFKEI